VQRCWGPRVLGAADAFGIDTDVVTNHYAVVLIGNLAEASNGANDVVAKPVGVHIDIDFHTIRVTVILCTPGCGVYGLFNAAAVMLRARCASVPLRRTGPRTQVKGRERQGQLCGHAVRALQAEPHAADSHVHAVGACAALHPVRPLAAGAAGVGDDVCGPLQSGVTTLLDGLKDRPRVQQHTLNLLILVSAERPPRPLPRPSTAGAQAVRERSRFTRVNVVNALMGESNTIPRCVLVAESPAMTTRPALLSLLKLLEHTSAVVRGKALLLLSYLCSIEPAWCARLPRDTPLLRPLTDALRSGSRICAKQS
jgi:hypothetical protein